MQDNRLLLPVWRLTKGSPEEEEEGSIFAEMTEVITAAKDIEMRVKLMSKVNECLNKFFGGQGAHALESSQEGIRNSLTREEASAMDSTSVRLDTDIKTLAATVIEFRDKQVASGDGCEAEHRPQWRTDVWSTHVRCSVERQGAGTDGSRTLSSQRAEEEHSQGAVVGEVPGREVGVDAANRAPTPRQ